MMAGPANNWIEENMIPYFPLGEYKDETGEGA